MPTCRALLVSLALVTCVGCHTAPLSTVRTADNDGYPVARAERKYPGFGPMEHKLVALNEKTQAVAAAHATLVRRADELDRDVGRYRARLRQVERENLDLRSQLAERDSLLATYFKRVGEAERTSRRLTARRGHVSRTTAVSVRSARLDALERENRRLRSQVADRDRLLAQKARRSPAPRREYIPVPPPSSNPTEQAVDHRNTPNRTGHAPARRATGQPAYHLRIIALSFSPNNTRRVDEIIAHLGRSGVNAPVRKRRSGQHWVIDIGDFASSRSPEAVALRHAIRTMRFNGRREFRSAYFTRY